MKHFSEIPISPDCSGLIDCMTRKSAPKRVHYFELFLDEEVQESIFSKYGLESELTASGAFRRLEKQVLLQKYLGYDYVRCGLDGFRMPLLLSSIEDTARIRRAEGRKYMEEHQGPITDWDSYEAYPWPDPERASTRLLEWYQENLPDDMCIVGSGGFAHFAELLTWLMGYETLCLSLYDQRYLVEAISRRLTAVYETVITKILAFNRVKLMMGSDDMGFRTATMISPDDLREFVLPGHRLMARMSHQAGRPYLLHSCGNLRDIMEDLIEDVKIDAKHSFEDTIEDVRDLKHTYGRRIALIGGIDVDFLCRADQGQVRARVRDTLKRCMPGGGYVLGTGNSVANYIPVENYLAMLDEGRRFVP